MSIGRVSGRRSVASAGQNVIIVAEASSAEELRTLTPNVAEIPDGVRGRVIIDGPFIGPLADLAFAEQLWGERLAPVGATVTDVFGDGLNRAVVEYRVPAAGTAAQGFARAGLVIVALAILAAVAGAALAIGWAITKITVLFFGEEGSGGSVSGGLRLAVVAGILGGLLLLAGTIKKKSSPGRT